MKHYKQRNGKEGKKFMQVLNLKIWKQLQVLANNRGVTVQEYLRVIIIPDHLKIRMAYRELPIIKKKSKWSKRVRKGWKTRKANLQSKEFMIDDQAPMTLDNTPPETEREKSILATD